jgi:hypothetical protein
MQDFPSNSQKAKATDAPREKLEPVTSAKTRERKSGIGRKFKATFFNGSGREAIGYMVEEEVIPTVRDMFVNALQAGIERVVYGERTSARPRSRSSIMSHPPGHVPYDRISGSVSSKPPQPRTMSRQARARHDFQDLIIPTLQEANEVIDRLFDILSRDGEVTVAHLYELTGIRSEHTDYKFGWTSLRGARALGLRGQGFLLDLPEPETLR